MTQPTEREGYESRTYGSGMAADSEAELVAAITGRTSMSPEKRAEWEAQLAAMSATSEVFSGVGDLVLKSGEDAAAKTDQLSFIRYAIELKTGQFYGPFDSSQAASEWAIKNVCTGAWTMTPIFPIRTESP